MAYLKIENFKYGMDSRRNELAATAGTIENLVNAHINQGGEIEKRKKFDVYIAGGDELAENSFGLEATSNGLTTFLEGDGAAEYTGAFLDGTAFKIEELVLPGTGDLVMTGVVSSCAVLGKAFVIVSYTQDAANAENVMYYDGTLITGSALPTGFSNPTYCFAFKNQVYVLATGSNGPTLFVSAIGIPNDFATATGNLELPLAQHGTGYDTYLAISSYQDKIAIFSDQSIQIWNVDPDPEQWSISQVLRNTGLAAANSVVQIGDLDILYLSPSGIRSLRAKESTLNAITTDIGSPIDQVIIDKLATCSAAEISGICGTAEPLSGRYWLFIKDTIYVLSYYPSLKITAWATYEPKGTRGTAELKAFVVKKFLCYKNKLFARVRVAGESLDCTMYYGLIAAVADNPWTTNNAYDASEVTAELPWLDLGKPAHVKNIKGFDAVFNGSWTLKTRASYRILVPTWKTVIDNFAAATPEGQYFAWQALTTHLKVKLSTIDEDRVTFSNLMIHFNEGAAK